MKILPRIKAGLVMPFCRVLDQASGHGLKSQMA